LGAFETDLENVKLAWMWLCKYPDPVRFVALEDVVLLFDARARFDEGVALFIAVIRGLTKLDVLEYKKSDISTIALACFQHNTAFLLYRMAKNSEALEYAFYAKALLENMKPTELHIKTLSTLGNIAEKFNQPEIQLNYIKEAVALAENLNMPFRKAITINNLGRLQIKLGDYENGIKNLRLAYQCYNDIGEIRGMLYASLTILHQAVFVLSDSSKNTETQLIELLEESNLLKDEFLVHFATLYLIFFYINSNNLESSEKLIEEIRVLKYRNSHFPKSLFHLACGVINKKQNKLNESIIELKRAIFLAENNIQELQHALFEYGKVLILQQDFKGATEIFRFLKSSELSEHWIKLQLQEQAISRSVLPMSQKHSLIWLQDFRDRIRADMDQNHLL
jgi:tetratricopeptide (TPR) repeat protein